MREVVTVHNFLGSESFGERTLTQIGLPSFDLFVARTKDREISLLISGDRQDVLGPLGSLKPTIWTALQEGSRDLGAQEERLGDA